MNQTSHSRPFLPTYDQALGVGLSEQSVLRLPGYKECHLARHTPYCRYTPHPRFFCNDNVPAYDEALTAASPPSRRAPTSQNVPPPPPQAVDPAKAERDKNALKDFFDWLATLFVVPGEDGVVLDEGNRGVDQVKIEN